MLLEGCEDGSTDDSSARDLESGARVFGRGRRGRRGRGGATTPSLSETEANTRVRETYVVWLPEEAPEPEDEPDEEPVALALEEAPPAAADEPPDDEPPDREDDTQDVSEPALTETLPSTGQLNAE